LLIGWNNINYFSHQLHSYSVFTAYLVDVLYQRKIMNSETQPVSFLMLSGLFRIQVPTPIVLYFSSSYVCNSS
jgi:hypothetical protein